MTEYISVACRFRFVILCQEHKSRKLKRPIAIILLQSIVYFTCVMSFTVPLNGF